MVLCGELDTSLVQISINSWRIGKDCYSDILNSQFSKHNYFIKELTKIPSLITSC